MTTTISAAATWLDQHRGTLDGAREAIRTRSYFSGYPEMPSGKIYGETANDDGKAAFTARNGTVVLSDGGSAAAATERSPFGIDMSVTYPQTDVAATIERARAAMPAWVDAGFEARTGVALEMLARLNRASFEIAYATMHTTGQSFMMAFQAGGPHAQDRALEAVAYAYDEMARIPERVTWEKPQGKAEPLRIDKTYRIVPRGVALAIGCSTFPNWNSYPGMFASLVTGNALVVKPHPQAILPLAISIEIMRATLAAAGFDPNLVQLAVDAPGAPLAKTLAQDPAVAIIDYTGSTGFGTWLETNAAALVYSEKAGVNPVILDSTADFKGMTRNLALSVSLYAGQMCTTPQNIFVPRDGIMTNDGRVSFDDVVAGIVSAIDGLLGPTERAVEILGAIATDVTLERLEAEAQKPGVVRASTSVEHPLFPNARVRTPLVAVVDAADQERFGAEMFGPIVYIVKTASTDESFAIATAEAQRAGAITAIVHSTDPGVLAQAEAFAQAAQVSLGINLTGTLVVNQSAAFSDYHVTGGNAAGNASLTDAAFVANRFRVIETRTPTAAAE